MTTSAIPGSVEAILTGLVHASWQASILALIVIVVSLVMRERLEPRWRFCLWLLVLVRLALPVIPSAPWSVFQLMKTAPEVQITNRQPDSDTVIPSVQSIVPNAISETPIATPEPIAEASTHLGSPVYREVEPAPIALDPSPVTLEVWLAIAWLTGLFVVLFRFGWSSVLLLCERRSWREINDPAVLEVLRQCLIDLHVSRRLRLLSAPGQFGPATCGFLRPSIVIPENLLFGLSANELRLVLLHELTHVRRSDVLIDWLASHVVAVHWFNPVAWLAIACLRRNRELACDAAVLRHLGEHDRGYYGHTLLSVAKRVLTPVRIPGLVGALINDHSLVRRILMIAKFQTPRITDKIVGVILILALAAVGLTDAGAGPVRGDDPAPPPTEKKEPAANVVLTGICEDETGKALSGVQVFLYRPDKLTSKEVQFRKLETGADGRFEFPDLPPIAKEESDTGRVYYLVAATKPGRGSRAQRIYAG
ncbi:MAG TPA: M56 family metallopeptidase, partial [Gemmata sp.]|nr:M56 family metallopeptidase [Gemmata sp.]